MLLVCGSQKPCSDIVPMIDAVCNVPVRVCRWPQSFTKVGRKWSEFDNCFQLQVLEKARGRECMCSFIVTFSPSYCTRVVPMLMFVFVVSKMKLQAQVRYRTVHYVLLCTS